MHQVTQKSVPGKTHGGEVRSHPPLTSLLPRAAPAAWTRAAHGQPLQTKLVVNHAGDAHEQEAEEVAAQVMRMPDSAQVGGGRRCACGGITDETGECPACRAQRLARRELMRKSDAAGGQEAPPSVDATLRGAGQPLEAGARRFMEAQFGQDFGSVRVHTGELAGQSAQEVGAHAYTVGQNIVFGQGRYAPGTSAGKQLLAHELAHVVQQQAGVSRHVLQRRSGCSSAQDSTIDADHAKAREMLSNAIDAVAAYDGTSPAKVHTALTTHFHGATSNAFATWINVNLRYLWLVTWMAGYECYTGGLLERTWACGSGALATTFWCVPTVAIRLCPSYFGQSDTERATTLIHEWVHKYGCNFDLGYEGETGYSGNRTLTQLLNADSFSSFIRDVQ
jgi:hypothetical protein